MKEHKRKDEGDQALIRKQQAQQAQRDRGNGHRGKDEGEGRPAPAAGGVTRTQERPESD